MSDSILPGGQDVGDRVTRRRRILESDQVRFSIACADTW
jgi:hypothetical protein